MQKNKPHFMLNRKQRNGVLYLSICILILQLFYYFFSFPTPKIIDVNSAEILFFQAKIDSLKQLEIAKRKPKIYPFNPSFLTDYKASKLGMTNLEIDRLLSFREKGKYINSAKQFQEVTKISDSLLHKIKPYFKFPDWVTKSNSKATFKRLKKTPFDGVKKELNNATENELQKINGIGKILAARILKFKTSIGGFKNKNQVEKVYGLKPEVVTKILEKYYVKESKIISKINTIIDLNKATANELKKINGIGEKLSERIIKFRTKIGAFYFEDQLQEVYGLKPEVITRLFLQFKILSKPILKKVNINEATFKEILHTPYINYELTKKIFDYKEEFAEIQQIEELKKIEGFPLDKYDRIILYLKTE